MQLIARLWLLGSWHTLQMSDHAAAEIPLISLPNWVKAAAACGFSIESVFRGLGIEADLMHIESATIAACDMERVMSACVSRSRRQHFPLVLGQTFGFEYLPDVEAFMTTSRTLRESARVFEWLQLLLNPNLKMVMVETAGSACIQLDWQSRGLHTAFPWFVEAAFTSVLKFGRALLNERGDFLRATFQQAPPPYAAQIREAWKLPIQFEQAHNALHIEPRLLDIPLGGASDTLHRQAELRVTQRLSERLQPADMVTRLINLFERRPELLGEGVGVVSAQLKLHPRTLQRRLSAEGENYGQIQSRVRMNLAVQWLAEESLDIEVVSERLGFSDRRSFTRAFSRWTGQSPRAYRQRR